ncbi:MAG: MFS transporter [Chloroflexota bacterium]|nr:MFS transporter [Dehalococcoidia bacterium]MDW8254664.1 MFS transporter [Chloroflexota bacterium]
MKVIAPMSHRSRPLPAARSRETWTLLAAILGSSMVFLESTVVAVALPALQADFAATLTDIQWVVAAFTLPLSALLLVGGALSDRYGRRRMVALGAVLFALGSAASGLAPTIGALIAARVVQGIGGAVLAPGALAMLSAGTPQQRRSRAIALWSAATGGATAVGPLLGGGLIELLSWRGVFFLNLPIAIVVVAILLTRVPESRDDRAAGRLDWPGALLATLGLGGVVFGLIRASAEDGGAVSVVVPLAAGIATLVLFVMVEARAAQPVMPLALFRSREFCGANALTVLLYGAVSGALFLLPFTLIQVQGYAAAEAGAAIVPFFLLLVIVSRWAGGLVERSGAQVPLVAGPSLVAIGLALFALPGIGGSYWTTIFPAVAVLGLGMGITVPPLTIVVMNSVDHRLAGVAAGVNNALSRAAGLLAVVLFSLVVATAFNAELDRRVAALAPAPEARASIDAQRRSLAAATVPATVPDAPALNRAVDEAYLAGYRLAMLLGAALAAAGAAIARLTVRGAPPAVQALEE